MSSTMLAGRLDLVNTKFEMTHIDVPEPGVGEVRVKVRAAGICLSDVHLIDGTLTKDDIAATGAWQPTVTLGHEVAGEVEKVGPGVPPMWKVGARVLLAAGKRCGSCPPCIFDSGPCLRPQTRGVNYDGGWAEYAITHYQALIPIPDDLPFEQAAVIPDAVSTSYAGLVRTGGLRPGRSIGLWGVGGLGVHAVQIRCPRHVNVRWPRVPIWRWTRLTARSPSKFEPPPVVWVWMSPSMSWATPWHATRRWPFSGPRVSSASSV